MRPFCARNIRSAWAWWRLLHACVASQPGLTAFVLLSAKEIRKCYLIVPRKPVLVLSQAILQGGMWWRELPPISWGPLVRSFSLPESVAVVLLFHKIRSQHHHRLLISCLNWEASSLGSGNSFVVPLWLLWDFLALRWISLSLCSSHFVLFGAQPSPRGAIPAWCPGWYLGDHAVSGIKPVYKCVPALGTISPTFMSVYLWELWYCLLYSTVTLLLFCHSVKFLLSLPSIP